AGCSFARYAGQMEGSDLTASVHQHLVNAHGVPSWRNPAPAPFWEPLHPPENRLEFDLDQNRSFASAQQCRRERRFVRNPRPIRGGCDARVFTATKAPVAAQRVRAIVAALDGEAGRSAARNRPPGL